MWGSGTTTPGPGQARKQHAPEEQSARCDGQVQPTNAPKLPPTNNEHAQRWLTKRECCVRNVHCGHHVCIGYGAINQAVNNHGALQEQQARLIAIADAARVLRRIRATRRHGRRSTRR